MLMVSSCVVLFSVGRPRISINFHCSDGFRPFLTRTSSQFIQAVDQMALVLMPRQIISSRREGVTDAIFTELSIVCKLRNGMQAPSNGFGIVASLFSPTHQLLVCM